MDGAAYSPLDSHSVPPQARRTSQPPADFPSATDGGPPLVPIPERDARGSSYEQPYPPYDRPHPGGDRPPYDAPPPSGWESRPPYDDRAGYYGGRPPHDDPYGHYPPPPRHDPYYGRPPPAHDYYSRPPPPLPHGYGAPRDPYGYPPRDYYNAYPPAPPPPRDPYYREPYPRDPYSAGPPPPSSVPPPPAPPPPPSFGPPPDPNDLSIPLLYLARSVNLKTFTPLRPQYANLDMRFINSLLDLDKDLHTVSLEHPNLLGHRRRVWVTAVGGTDALVHRVRTATTAVLDWREVGDIDELQRELAIEDRRVIVVREENAEKERRKEREESERREREKQEAEMERGRREIEERGAQVKSEPQELDEVLRQMTGATAPSAAANGVNGEAEPLFRADSHQVADGDVSVEYVEGVTRPEEPSTSEESPYPARKRSRRDSDGVPDEDRERRRAQRKKLEAVCKADRRSCVDWAMQNNVPVNDETRMVDDEPQLGERHKGIWDLFGQPLDEVSPQIQVLMARAMRDATYPPRLRLYEHPDALEQLQAAVPWFVTMLNIIKDRYELLGAGSVVPQDPPMADHPFDTLPESSREVPTLSSLAAADGQPALAPIAETAPVVAAVEVNEAVPIA
ncbi:hypothetical protein JCM10213_002537 [Rhodosporidiobolus nylandii]